MPKGSSPVPGHAIARRIDSSLKRVMGAAFYSLAGRNGYPVQARHAESGLAGWEEEVEGDPDHPVIHGVQHHAGNQGLAPFIHPGEDSTEHEDRQEAEGKLGVQRRKDGRAPECCRARKRCSFQIPSKRARRDRGSRFPL